MPHSTSIYTPLIRWIAIWEHLYQDHIQCISFMSPYEHVDLYLDHEGFITYATPMLLSFDNTQVIQVLTQNNETSYYDKNHFQLTWA